MNFLIGFDISLEPVITHELSIQIKRFLLLLLQGDLKILLALDKHLVAFLKGENGIVARLLKLFLQTRFQFEGLLQVRVLRTIAKFQVGHFALLFQ